MKLTLIQQEWFSARIEHDLFLILKDDDSNYLLQKIGYFPSEEDFWYEQDKVKKWIKRGVIPTAISKLHFVLIHECYQWAQGVWQEYLDNCTHEGRGRSLDNLEKKFEIWEQNITFIRDDTSQVQRGALGVMTFGPWYQVQKKIGGKAKCI